MNMQPGDWVNREDVAPYPYRHLFVREKGYAHTILLYSADKPYPWAIVARQVGGWKCLATGEMPDAPDENTMVSVMTERFDFGHDYLPREQFAVTKPSSLDVHLRRTVGEPATYCNTVAPNPYVHVTGKYFQHCTECTTNYRAEHFGRHPFEEH